jgi:hypothetical protein
VGNHHIEDQLNRNALGRIDKQRVSAGKQMYAEDTVDEIQRHHLARSF